MGSFCVDAADIFTDPPAFPPFKLVSRGEVRRDLEEMFLRQSRVPTVLDAGERTVAQRLSKRPDGRWSQRVYAEAARTGDTGTRRASRSSRPTPTT